MNSIEKNQNVSCQVKMHLTAKTIVQNCDFFYSHHIKERNGDYDEKEKQRFDYCR